SAPRCLPPATHLSLHDALPISAHELKPATGSSPVTSCVLWSPPVKRPAPTPEGSPYVPAAHSTSPRPTGLSRASATDTCASCNRSEEHTSELQSRFDLVCRPLL